MVNFLKVAVITKRILANKFGLLSELLILFLLKIKLYKILQHRYTNSFGEIDIIAKKNNTIFFIEVKYRSKKERIEESFSQKQYKRIKRSALYFLAKNNFSYKTNVIFRVYYIAASGFFLKIKHADIS